MMHEELRKEILRILNAASITSVATVPVVFYDHVPQDTTSFPYGALGDADVAAEDTADISGALLRFPVTVFSSYKGGRETAAILDGVREALHHQEAALVLTTCTACTMYVEGTTESPNTDEGKTREAVAIVSVLVYGIAAGTA